MSYTSRHQSPELSWEMVTREADPALRSHLRSITSYVEESRMPVRRREVPSGDITVILSPNTELVLPDVREPSRQPARHRSFVAALHDTHALVEHGGYQEGIELRLTPLGAHSLFGLPMHELTNRVVELEDVWGADGRRLVERLWDVPEWDRRLDLAETLVADRLGQTRPPSRELRWAWWRLRETYGRTSVRGLADELGWSHRRLIARFREGIGMPPKAVARVLRFERASLALRELAEPRLAELALDCGYYDQAHMGRDFREFAGATPGEYLSARLPEGGGVTS